MLPAGAAVIRGKKETQQVTENKKRHYMWFSLLGITVCGGKYSLRMCGARSRGTRTSKVELNEFRARGHQLTEYRRGNSVTLKLELNFGISDPSFPYE